MKSTTAPETAPVSVPADPGPPKNYLDLYGLSKPPFSGTREKGGYILFSSHRRAVDRLIQHVENGSGIVLLQGEEGIGKTETLRALAAVATESHARAIMISRPANGRISLMQLVSALEGQPSADNVPTDDDAIAHFLAPPRKALLVDDFDLMPADCVRLLLSLARRMPTNLKATEPKTSDPGATDPNAADPNAADPGAPDPEAPALKAADLKAPDPKAPEPRTPDPRGPVIILTTSTDLTAEPKRPDLSEFPTLARDTIRIPRLGPTEIRQYIERSLWIAGGTTRRLIAADAMKLLVLRSGGVPGITNRLMEAVLTAGFARGESMITAKTVAAAMGPTAPRPRQRVIAEPSATTGRVVQAVSVGLLVLGASAFLYRGLSGKVERVSPAPAASVAPAAPAPPALVPPAFAVIPGRPSAGTLPPDLVAALMKRGDQSLALGDIAAARLLYQRAAEAGNAPAAVALAKTYDPNFAAPGGKPDPARAAEWYQNAIALGDSHAPDLLKRLSSH